MLQSMAAFFFAQPGSDSGLVLGSPPPVESKASAKEAGYRAPHPNQHRVPGTLLTISILYYYYMFAYIVSVYYYFCLGHWEHFVETSITSKGQVVIPSAIRRRFGIKEGTRFALEVDESGQRIILIPITKEYVDSHRGRLRGKGLLKALAAEKKRERQL